ncbi:MAG: hypothetical protein ABGW69_00230 [Nanoarchaeota archaeon]
MEKEESVKNSDTIVLSVPILVMPKVLEEVYPFLNKYSKKEKSFHSMFVPKLKEVKGQNNFNQLCL